MSKKHFEAFGKVILDRKQRVEQTNSRERIGGSVKGTGIGARKIFQWVGTQGPR